MGLRLTVVDSFTDRPFTGNPAAVALVEAFPPDELMQAVASEMNLSETAFVVRGPDDLHDLRWFTPLVEVDLCGHATLASAHVLGGSPRFRTRSGVLACSSLEDGWIEMDLPADVPSRSALPPSLDVGEVIWYGTGKSDTLIELPSAAEVRAFVPDLQMLAALGSRAVIVTGRGEAGGADCVSRVFAPNVGIPEDPVTGSAHCTLAAYWGSRLGKRQLVGEQASARRGTVRMKLEGDRVKIAGRAVTTLHVQLVV